MIILQTIPNVTPRAATFVDGEDVTVRSKAHPERQFRMKYMDMVVIPASMGEVELVNNKPGTWTVMHKTMLKRGV